MANVSVTVQNASAVVPRNANYQFNFTIAEPTTSITNSYSMTDGGTIGSGHLFTLTIDKTKWQSISNLAVI